MPDRVSDQSTPIHYSQVRCTGEQESLLDCNLSETIAGCNHDRDAAIVCRRSEEVGHVRLVGDARDEVGAVELYYPDIGWTGICADPERAHYWLRDNQPAEIVCRQLGYLRGRAYVDPLVDIANRTVTIDGCDIDENFDLVECNTSVLDSGCNTDDLAWVQCTRGSNEFGDTSKAPAEMREGVMQLEFNGRLGHICDTGWDNVDAEVACVEIDLHDSNKYDTSPEGNFSRYISDLMPIWVTDVQCSTTTNVDAEGNVNTDVNENDIIDCEISSMYPVGFTNCHFHQFRDSVALVDCGTRVDPLLAVYIIVGVLSPFIFIGLVVLFCCLRKKFCNDCDCSCRPYSRRIRDCSCSSIGYAIGNCCECIHSRMSSCIRGIKRRITSRRILRFGSFNDTAPTTTLEMTSHSTNTGTTQVTETQPTPGDVFYEPQGDEETPLADPGFTKPAPPTYTEATTYATVQDKVATPPPPDYTAPSDK